MVSATMGLPEAEASGVEKCLVQIRAMVLSGELLPGQKVHQSALAEALGVSRIPVREALSKLQSEGVLVHKPNTGFTVARFSGEDLSEIYLMRRLLETELLRSIDFSLVDFDTMQHAHEEMIALSSGESPEAFQECNYAFHFALFDASPLELVRQELSRLWYMSGFYRSMHLREVETLFHLQSEHEQIIRVARSGDVDQLIKESDAHRTWTERVVVNRLGRSRKPR